LASTTEAEGHTGRSEFHSEKASIREQAESVKGQAGVWRAATASSENTNLLAFSKTNFRWLLRTNCMGAKNPDLCCNIYVTIQMVL